MAQRCCPMFVAENRGSSGSVLGDLLYSSSYHGMPTVCQ
ncbi:hypothetical protein FLM9_328 [Candidatus Synechococcus spongiarum]|uniref:Uncharacterized protein n=1 Tax=Candidatus Synechococcus spongiarum TaxID=431041 RepID=A0A171DF76_9SYNE|nr:hypothetical protein FLM9_328 [Candidatus Synechococcus spongiarum]